MTRTNQTIQVSYWQRAKDKELSPDEKLIELFLMTCPECGASGVFRMDTSSIAYDIGYPEAKVKGILKTLEEKNRVFIFDGNWVFVRGKFEYEPSRSPKIIKCVENEVSVSSKPVIEQFLKVYNTLWDTLPDSLSNTLSVTNTTLNTISNTDTPDETSGKLEPYIAFAKELFPKSENSQLEKQAIVLEQIVRIDKVNFQWVQKILRWGRKDNFWGGTPFQSCSTLRTRKPAGDPMKWQKIADAFKTDTGYVDTSNRVLGWQCIDCGFMGDGKQPTKCPHCDYDSFKTGNLKPDWQDRNKQLTSGNNVSGRSTEALTKLSNKMNTEK